MTSKDWVFFADEGPGAARRQQLKSAGADDRSDIQSLAQMAKTMDDHQQTPRVRLKRRLHITPTLRAYPAPT